jgi:spore germination cell wall hydrolase CwlJ-like protein
MNYFVLSTLVVIALFAQSCHMSPIAPDNLTIVNPPIEVLTERQKQIIHNLKEEACLTEAIYYEAGNQSEVGKEAVALVVMNRVAEKHRPNTVCGVVAQAHVVQDRKVCQFSFWCEAKYKPNKVAWEESQKIARRVLRGYVRKELSDMNGVLFYHAAYVRPGWAKHKERVVRIGDHIFYREPYVQNLSSGK